MKWQVRVNYDYQGLHFRTKVSSFTIMFLLNTSNMVDMFLSVFVFPSVTLEASYKNPIESKHVYMMM